MSYRWAGESMGQGQVLTSTQMCQRSPVRLTSGSRAISKHPLGLPCCPESCLGALASSSETAAAPLERTTKSTALVCPVTCLREAPAAMHATIHQPPAVPLQCVQASTYAMLELGISACNILGACISHIGLALSARGGYFRSGCQRLGCSMGGDVMLTHAGDLAGRHAHRHCKALT